MSFPKPDTTLEKLSRLPLVYGSPTVTAGNAPDSIDPDLWIEKKGSGQKGDGLHMWRG